MWLLQLCQFANAIASQKLDFVLNLQDITLIDFTVEKLVISL